MGYNLLQSLRLSAQWFGLFVSNGYLAVFFRGQIYRGPLKSACVPFLYCHACPCAVFSCPIGAAQHYATIHKVPFYILGHFTLLGLLVGRMACGWLCPFGWLQDLLHKITSKKYRIPRFMATAPYFIVLMFVLLLPFVTGEHWFSKLCPLGTLVAGIPWVTWNPIDPATGSPTVGPDAVGLLFIIKLLLLGAVLYLAVCTKRPFCRIVCPVGLFLSFFNKISLLKLEVASSCDGCNACQERCPMDVNVHETPNAADCVKCLKCTACEHVSVAGFPKRDEPAVPSDGIHA